MKMFFTEAILDATKIIMKNNRQSIYFGLGINDDRGLQGSTRDLSKIFGTKRVFDIPVAEDAMMGFAVGSAISGVTTIFNHARMDFLLLTFNQLFNVATKFPYMFDGAYPVPLIIRCLVGNGWGAQHSQVLSGILSSFPGTTILCPSSPAEAKGLLIKAANAKSPVIFMEDHRLYSLKSEVKKGSYEIDFNFIKKITRGKKLTIVALSSAAIEVEKFFNENKEIDADIFIIMSTTHYNREIIFNSVKKTKKLLFIQNAWLPYGTGANIARELLNKNIKFKYREIGFPFTPTPFSKILEEHYYVSLSKIKNKVNNFIIDK